MKTILVTGATGNLGKVVCSAFSENGWRVVALSYHSPDDRYLTNLSNVHMHRINLAMEDDVNLLYDEICELYEDIRGGVFLAGGFNSGSLASTGKNEIRHMFELNFETAYYLSRKLFLHLESQKSGRLCFIGSVPAIDSGAAKQSVAYALSKSLVIKLSDIFNATGNSSGVYSCVFIPSVIDTSDNRKSMPGADFSHWVSPELIAKTIREFCEMDQISASEIKVRFFRK